MAVTSLVLPLELPAPVGLLLRVLLLPKKQFFSLLDLLLVMHLEVPMLLELMHLEVPMLLEVLLPLVPVSEHPDDSSEHVKHA